MDPKACAADASSDDSKIENGEDDVSMNESDDMNNIKTLQEDDHLNTSTQSSTSSEKAMNDATEDVNTSDDDILKQNSDVSPIEGKGTGDSNGDLDDHKTSEGTLENGSVASSLKKRRRSSAMHIPVGDSPDVTHRSSGRNRKPKPDAEDFLPTDAVLGKSPKKGRKSVDFILSPGPMKETVHANGSLEDSISEENGTSDSNGDPKEPLDAMEGSAEAAAAAVEVLAAKYEPGDLIWGRLGHYPFWPCIVMRDPVDRIFHKKGGRGRTIYHVLFYGDNGKRSWVSSSNILQFLGLQDFEMQAAAVTGDMKKKDPKLYPGFVIKPALKTKWTAAVCEAEKVMPMTRSERLDDFLETMPQKKGRKSKAIDDDEDVDEDNANASAREVNTEGEQISSPTSAKKKSAPKTESPVTEKKKRGRPRKIQENSDEMEMGTPEPVAKSTPGPGRGRKRKLQTEAELNQDSKDDPNLKSGTKKKRKKKKDKKAQEDKAFSIFSEKHLDRVHDDHPDLSEEEALKYLSNLWDQKDEEEKTDYIRLVATDEKSEDESEDDDDEDEKEDDNEPDDTGVEDEVPTVPASTVKETNEDDLILLLNSKKINLFKGYKAERVCQVCEKPGKTVKCRGPCAGVFHVECARGADNSVCQFSLVEDTEDKPKKRGRKKIEKTSENNDVEEAPKPKVSRHKEVYADEETDSDLDYADGEVMPEACDEESIRRMLFGNTEEEPEVSIVYHTQSEDEDDVEEDDHDIDSDDVEDYTSANVSSITDFRCGDCAVFRTPLCYACGQASVPSGEDSVRVRCSVAHCGKHYHIECLKVLWPQASYNSTKGVVNQLSCPQHLCHTCVSDNPREKRGRFVHEKLIRCIRCPTSYHYGNYCVPAGSKLLTASQMICPRHYEPPKKKNHHINTTWCFLCVKGGSLICCDLCPMSFHKECLNIEPPSGSYICEDCETGRYPLYNEVLWVKLGNYRWWPALSLFPSQIPDNVVSLPHRLGEFAVRFLGTNDHYWIERGRCFRYHEGDDGWEKKTAKSNIEKSYQKGVLQANGLFKAHDEKRKEIQSQVKITAPVKPPQYIKIKSNKPVGNVRIVEVDTSTISPCECNPNSEHPCSPGSECLNRILMVECDPNTCPAGEKCENQYFEKRIYPSLAPCYTDGRGWGLKVLEAIPKGTFVIEYVGEVIDDEEYQKRLLKKHQEKDENYYFLTIDSTRIIDAGPKGNVSRFMNHSCQPNCETQKWTVMGDTRVGLFSLIDIPANTELTFNYNLESKGNEKKPCMCGTPICSGFIGAKKNKAPVIDTKELSSSGKKKRRKPRVRNFAEDICLLCDTGKEEGVLVSCINKECASKYHLTCLGLASHPLGKWLCPRHHCNVCQKRTQQWCSYCTESYCPAHYDDNLINDPLHGDICEVHQKKHLSKDHLKTKRDEQRKQMEEEKRKIDEEKKKQYEEERARRSSRRDQIRNGETAVAKSPDVDDTFSDGSGMGDIDAPVNVKKELTKENLEVSTEKKENPRASLKPLSSKKTPKANVVSEVKDASPVPSRRGRKKKVVPVDDNNLNLTGEIKKELPQSIEDDLKEIKMLKPNLTEESQISSSHCNDAMKDDIPDADPTLDKFILAPVPMDDSPETFSKKKRKKSVSPKSDNALPNEASPSSVTKRRRKPPSHNMDYVNSQSLNLKRPYLDSSPDKPSSIKKLYSKKSKETKFDKMGLTDELEDIATGFLSDDSQESPKIHLKKGGGRGKRLSLGHGHVRSHTADSTTGDIPDTTGKDKSGSHMSPMSPKKLKSPVTPLAHLPPGSPEKLSASKIFAMQRAKGLKVMPPNRRLSSAREQALGSRLDDVPDDRVERSGKGLKVMKGRRFSGDSIAEQKKTENLHGEVLQSGGLKKVRPILSKVEDNGVSVEDDVEDKALENGLLQSPKQPQPHPMQSPPSKKMRAASPKKSPIGVCSLWNQDLIFG